MGGTSYAYSREELRDKAARRIAVAGDVLVQRFVRGSGFGWACLAWDGQTFLPFQWLRVREADPRGSGSSAAVSTALDPEADRLARDLLRRIDFQGIAMVEFKRQRTPDRLVLIEINGRPWGSIQLPIHCGVDYPIHLLAVKLNGKTPPKEVDYKEGITCRRLTADFDHLVSLRRGTPPGWPVPYPGFISSFAKISIPWYPGLRYDDLSLRDLRPGMASLYRWFKERL